MQRKVIQIADSTQLVSIPRQWAKKYNIKKGDELEVTEKDNVLEVSTKKEDQVSEITVDVTGIDRTTLIYAVRSAYRRGYDVIKVKFDNKTAVHYRTGEKELVSTLLQQELQRWVGMQIIEQKENYFVYKSISKVSFEDFDLMLRRTFLLLIDASEDFLKGTKEKDTLLLQTIEGKYDNIVIFITYCMRLLNKIGFPEKYKNSLLHVILSNLNKIADVLKYAARDIVRLKKIHPKTEQALIEIFQTIRIYYDLFYKYDLNKFSKIYEKRDNILRELETVKKVIPVEELMLCVYSRHLLELIVSNLEATATYNLNNKDILSVSNK